MNQEVLLRDLEPIAALPLPWDGLRGKRIFITGATGFIGGYLAKALCWLNSRMSLGLRLGLFHRAGTEPVFSAPCVQWTGGDIAGDFLPADFRPDIIIHGASPANRKAIAADSAGVVNCNILATRYLLEKTRSSHACFLFFSSGEVYPKHPMRVTEEKAVSLVMANTLSLYGSSKLIGELLCEEYRSKYGTDSRVLRPFSVFGPGEPLTSGRCFTDFMRQASEAHRIRIDGSGTQIRSYCYLSDFVSGLLYVLLRGESTVYNIGNEDNTCSVQELARQMARIYGDTEVIGPLSAADRADFFVPDTTKLRQLGWRPQVSLEECMKRCMDSYR